MDIIRTLQPGAVIFILVGVTVLGGAIGSFLNVVIYRLPAGQSLNRPSSRCPCCGHAIRPWHNIPVFGWLLLRGKCYDCGEPISVRYPVIEAIVAIMFLVVVWMEWFGLRSSFAFPLPEVTEVRRSIFDPLSSFSVLVTSTVLDLMLLTTLLGVGMIEWDRKRVPRSIWLPVIVTSVIFTLFLSWDGNWSLEISKESAKLLGLNAAVGLIMGALLIPSGMINKPTTPPGRLLLSFLCVGLVLNFWVVMFVGFIYVVVQLVEAFLLWIGTFSQGEVSLRKSFPHGLWLWWIIFVSLMFIYLYEPFLQCF